jgi:hypothetical protein
VLSLSSSRWSELWHVYGYAVDVPAKLSALYSAITDAEFDAILSSLMTSIYHQHDTTTAAYACVPHLNRIRSNSSEHRRLSCLRSISLIELARSWHQNTSKGAAVPDDLSDAYFETVGQFPKMIAESQMKDWDRDDLFNFAATLLAINGEPRWAGELTRLARKTGLACPECGAYIELPR